MLTKHSTSISLGRNRYQTSTSLKPINYQDGNIWKHINNSWVDSGIVNRPHMVTTAPFMVSVAPDGDRRIHPTREQDVWFEISGTKINNTGTWEIVQLGTPTSRIDNRITWNRTNFNAYIDMSGHFIKLGFLLKNGFLPPNNQFAYEVATNGLTRSGCAFYKDGVPVMHMRSPIAYDYDNPDDVRQISHELVRISGKWHVVFTLPSLVGMSKPVIDPTLELQPDAAAGEDTIIASGAPDYNYGISAAPYMDLNQYLLIHFDLSPISPPSTVNSSTLILLVQGKSARTFGVHKGLVEWFEGIKDASAPGAEDGSTWNHKNANTGGQVAWAGGAGGAGGTEYTAVPTSTYVPSSTGYKSITGLGPDVQDWVTTPSNNFGWWHILQGASDNCRINSSDHITPANRPELVTNWTAAASKNDTTPQFFPILFDKKKH